jgi:hypothetical protein
MNTDLANARFRAIAAWIIGIVSLGFGVFLIWKMILFVRGDAHSWLIDTINHSRFMMRMERSLDDVSANLLGVFCYYVYGTSSFLCAASLVLLAGQAAARIVEVGWTQFRCECREESARIRLEAACERRRQKRIEARRSKANKEDCDDLLWMTAAVALVAWLL